MAHLSWCSRSRIQLLGTSEKWRRASSLQISQLSVPLTAQLLHLRLAELKIYPRASSAEVYFMKLHVHIQMCSDKRYTRVADAGSKRKMMCWGTARPRPGPRLHPLERGGRQPCTGLRVVLPPVRKSPVRRGAPLCVVAARTCRKGCGHGDGAGRARMDGADAPACSADLRRVHDRPRHRLARCLRLRCRCCASVAGVMSLSGAMRVDALGAVPSVQPQ